MAQFQITSWREIPSLVTAREGDEVAKVPLPTRFQEAIDEAAMRVGDTASETYLAGWVRGPWTDGAGDPASLAAAAAQALEEHWTEQAVTDFLESLRPADDAV